MSGRNRTILLVDDEAYQREWMSRALRAAGYGVVVASDYRMALARFQEHSGEIDMLLTDLALPDKNGYELANALQAIQPKLKALFASAQVGAELHRFYGMAATDEHFLPKPFRPADLVRRVRDLMERAEPARGAHGTSGE
jgi:two-component system, cell cycle sensor histidine kinase and response regulator CckA